MPSQPEGGSNQVWQFLNVGRCYANERTIDSQPLDLESDIYNELFFLLLLLFFIYFLLLLLFFIYKDGHMNMRKKGFNVSNQFLHNNAMFFVAVGWGEAIKMLGG